MEICEALRSFREDPLPATRSLSTGASVDDDSAVLITAVFFTCLRLGGIGADMCLAAFPA